MHLPELNDNSTKKFYYLQNNGFYDINPAYIKMHILFQSIVKHSTATTIFIFSFNNDTVNSPEEKIIPFFFDTILPAIESSVL